MRTNDSGAANPRTLNTARTLNEAADTLFGDDFWGRERVNPGPAARLTTRAAPRRR